MELAGTERDALALHDATIAIAAALMPVVCLIEISLRNAVSERLRTVFASPGWLTAPPPPFAWRPVEVGKIEEAKRQAQQDLYTKLPDAQKRSLDALAFPNGIPENLKHNRRIKKRQANIPVTHGQLVAQLTMFFWKRLFSSDYEATLWKRGLKELFPNKSVKRGDVAAHLEALYKARNRIAHHEPLHGTRLRRVVAAIDFIVANLGVRQGENASALEELTKMHREQLSKVVEEASALFDSFVVSPSGGPGELEQPENGAALVSDHPG